MRRLSREVSFPQRRADIWRMASEQWSSSARVPQWIASEVQTTASLMFQYSTIMVCDVIASRIDFTERDRLRKMVYHRI
jgi:hypothetical protein